MSGVPGIDGRPGAPGLPGRNDVSWPIKYLSLYGCFVVYMHLYMSEIMNVYASTELDRRVTESSVFSSTGAGKERRAKGVTQGERGRWEGLSEN